MMYDRKEYERFLNAEFRVQKDQYENLIKTKALVLKSNGDVFVGKFLKFQDNGVAVFKVRYSDNMPRRNSFWTACYFVGDMGSFKNWGNRSWLDLRTDFQRDYSEANCIWLSKSEDPDFCIIGIKNLSIDFAALLDNDKPIVAFGPKDPPLKYILNLIDIVRDQSNDRVNNILDFNSKKRDWEPSVVDSQMDFVSIAREKLNTSDSIAIQGPPGTGKTFKIAQLIAILLRDNKSVLVTAFTNQALMQLAKKDDITPFILEGRVSKTSMTIDESKDIRGLLPIADNKCNATAGKLSLATFYVSSDWSKQSTEPPFDYIIVDEASQSLLPMIAASCKLGKKSIWMGDQNQLSPIVLINENVIERYNWSPIVKGFSTLCDNFNIPSYIFTDTYRLMPRAAESTGVFYNNLLRSASSITSVPSNLAFIDKRGGPVVINIDMKVGDKKPNNAILAICNLAKEILAEDPKAEIAILCKFRESVRELQKRFILTCPSDSIPENVKIDTVDRVQGLTVHYCIFFIPNASLHYSLDNELFNVATSRSIYNTIIVADRYILRQNMSQNVRKYLLKAQEDKFAELKANEPQRIDVGNVGLNVVGKIDLSKFERKRTELVTDKENVYIVDTNVFVTCPDIISKIGSEYKVIVPSKVLEELDKLKLKNSINKVALNSAARNICTAFQQKFSQMEDADVTLLPADFDTNNADCMILSVALKHKQENQHPILLTSDNILRTRAEGLGISTISLKEFLKN